MSIIFAKKCNDIKLFVRYKIILYSRGGMEEINESWGYVLIIFVHDNEGLAAS